MNQFKPVIKQEVPRKTKKRQQTKGKNQEKTSKEPIRSLWAPSRVSIKSFRSLWHSQTHLRGLCRVSMSPFNVFEASVFRNNI